MVFFLPPISVIQIRAKTSLFTIRTLCIDGNKTLTLNRKLNFPMILTMRLRAAKTSLFTITDAYELWSASLPYEVRISKKSRRVCRLGSNPELKFDDIREFAETRPGPVVANIALCLIHQANYLLDQQLRRLEQDFLKDGGLRERITKARLESWA